MRHDFFEMTENNRLACRCGWTFENWTSLERHIKMRTAMDGFIEERPMMKSKWPSVPGEATRALDAETDEEEER